MTRIDEAFQQLAHHHDTITTIQNTQTSHSAMLETQHADIVDIKASLQLITKSMADLNRKFDTLTPPSPNNQTSTVYSPSPNNGQPPILSTHTPNRAPKCTLSSFDGSNPHGWIFQAERFFAYYSTPENQRVELASFHMQGQALTWFQWMHRNKQLSSWTALSRAIEQRFGPPTFLNPQATLFKLKQITSVDHYQSTFETLCNRITTLPPESILQCFISGLKTHIQNELHLLKPTTITDAIEGARLIERKYHDPSRPTFTEYPNTHLQKPTNNQQPSQSFQQTPQEQTSKSHIPIKQLSQAEMNSRKQQGLCFNCDEKYQFGHRCKPAHILMILPDRNPDDTPPIVEAETEPPPNTDLSDNTDPTFNIPQEISFHVLSGSNHPRSIRLPATINGNPISILVDNGSTLNYLHPTTAKFLGIKPDHSTSFVVTVGNGEKLRSTGSCSSVQVDIQDHQFAIDFHLLEIAGLDAVCGIQWLEMLGPIAVDHKNLTMAFNFNNRPVFLTGLSRTMQPSPISVQQQKRLEATSTTGHYHDLEDKVDLDGVGVDTTTNNTPAQVNNAHINTRPGE